MPNENIILVGFMGTGKSSIGRHVAKRLGFQFLDTDHIITDRAGGVSIAEIFAQRGEPAFRDLETSAIESLFHLRRCVIATGGGAVLREENRRLLRELGFVVGLSAEEEVIFERVSRCDKRPLLHTKDPRGTLHRLLEARRDCYAEAAEFALDTSAIDHAEAADRIVAAARRAFAWEPAA